MSLIEPNSRIDFLRGIPFDPSYENTMYFDSLVQQISYFDTKIAVPFEKFSYVRADSGYIKVGWSIDGGTNTAIKDLYNANYMRFKNTSFEDKWFYAFVDRIEYINNNTVGVYYHLDVLQTWHFDYSFNQCFIERQHTETDVIGHNTIPEDFELGDYIFDNATEFDYYPYAVVVTAGDIGGTYQAGRVISGLSTKGNWFSGVRFYPYNLTDATQVGYLNQLLEDAYTDREKLNTIIAIFVMPNIWADAVMPPREYTVNVIPPGTGGYHLGNYPCRNAKLMTYPYNMLYVTNYQGGHLELHFEYFSNIAACKLKVWGNLSTNPGLVLYPNDYKTTGDNFDEMLQLTGFPMCAWANDAYKAWVAQNAGTINLAVAGVASSWVKTGLAYKRQNDTEKSGFIGSVMDARKNDRQYQGERQSFDKSLQSSIAATAALIARLRDHAVAPPTAHGSGNGNLQYQMGKMTFMWCYKHIRAEYAAIIDDFFDMYGYAVHRSGIPNRNARPCYTYVKTTDCSLDGNVPVNDLRLIEDIFNKGVRFWRTNATFGVYDLTVNNNAPII